MNAGPDPADLWTDALLAADLLAVDPAGLGGAVLRSGPGLARDLWLARCRAAMPAAAPWLKAPGQTGIGQLLGGLDLEATLACGRATAERGLLARADGGVLVLAMAERLSAASAAVIAAALDERAVHAERDGLRLHHRASFAAIALDEGAVPDEQAPAKLAERLAFRLDLGPVSHRDAAPKTAAPLDNEAVAAARRLLPSVSAPAALLHALTAGALALGVTSLRAPLLALRAARAAAALAGRLEAGEEDAMLAARLVLAHRALTLPPGEADQEQAPEPEPPVDQDASPPPDPEEIGRLDDVVLAAALAAIPKDLLSRLRMGATRRAASTPSQGAGESRASPRHGRPIGARRGSPRDGARLDLLATLRAAAPWQRLRRLSPPPGLPRPLLFRRDDLRVRRLRERQQAVTIFVVDASGSTALDRLAEAKGAIELLLADCYVRRDEVALIAFRGAGAQTLLPPTRSLQRAKRELAALPGGGGTPLAAGLIAAGLLAEEQKRKGRTPTLVVITDGRANVASSGEGGRAQAQAEASSAARALRARAIRAMVVDNAPRPEPKARALADEMGGLYLALPRANAAMLSEVAKAQGSEIWSGRR